VDSKGPVFVGDRSNNRVQVFDQDGSFLEEWKQFDRPSAIFIDQNDNLYVADNQSDAKNNSGFKRGIRIGSVNDGKVKMLIPGLGANPETQSVSPRAWSPTRWVTSTVPKPCRSDRSLAGFRTRKANPSRTARRIIKSSQVNTFRAPPISAADRVRFKPNSLLTLIVERPVKATTVTV